jgi:hypothetical protein
VTIGDIHNSGSPSNVIPVHIPAIVLHAFGPAELEAGAPACFHLRNSGFDQIPRAARGVEFEFRGKLAVQFPPV